MSEEADSQTFWQYTESVLFVLILIILYLYKHSYLQLGWIHFG